MCVGHQRHIFMSDIRDVAGKSHWQMNRHAIEKMGAR